MADLNPPATYQPHDDRGEFKRMLELFLAARAEHELSPIDDEDDDYALYHAQDAARDAVMGRAAPDIEAVLAKMEIATRNGLDLPPDIADDIRADLMRLSGIRRSPTFQPAVWLHYFRRQAGGRAMMARVGDAIEPCLLVPVRSTPIDKSRALIRLNDLEDAEAAAISDYIEQTCAPPAADDAAILAAWETRRAAFEARRTPDVETDDESKEHWRIVNEAEATIHSAVACTPRGVALQLMVALTGSLSTPEAEAATYRGDLAWLLAHEAGFDDHERFIVAALRSLETMEAATC